MRGAVLLLLLGAQAYTAPRRGLERGSVVARARARGGAVGVGGVGGADHLQQRSPVRSALARAAAFGDANFFILGMAAAVGGAAAFPALGADGSWLRPERVIGGYGVAAVFVLSGLGLRLSELRAAALNAKLNAATQLVSLGVIPALSCGAVFCVKRLAPASRELRCLLDGLLVTACLPTTVNMCVVLTQSAGGSVGPALANAVMGNALGVVVTPALLLVALKDSAIVFPPLAATMRKLSARVVLPVAIGQLLRAWPALLRLQQRRKGAFKKASELVLLAIVWNAFCTAFARSGFGVPAPALASLGIGLAVLHLVAFKACLLLFGRIAPPRDAVAAAFCASQKTLAFGLPLIKTVFAGSPDLAYLCAPIMLLHPTQLIIGSALVPRLRRKLDQAETQTSSET